jgi:hypothetical protein
MYPRLSYYGAASEPKTNAIKLEVGLVTLWFSYTGVVAFQVKGFPRVVHQNNWSTTTGSHLDLIDGGGRDAERRRVNKAEFERQWNERVAPLMDVLDGSTASAERALAFTRAAGTERQPPEPETSP